MSSLILAPSSVQRPAHLTGSQIRAKRSAVAWGLAPASVVAEVEALNASERKLLSMHLAAKAVEEPAAVPVRDTCEDLPRATREDLISFGYEPLAADAILSLPARLRKCRVKPLPRKSLLKGKLAEQCETMAELHHTALCDNEITPELQGSDLMYSSDFGSEYEMHVRVGHFANLFRPNGVIAAGCCEEVWVFLTRKAS